MAQALSLSTRDSRLQDAYDQFANGADDNAGTELLSRLLPLVHSAPSSTLFGAIRRMADAPLFLNDEELARLARLFLEAGVSTIQNAVSGAAAALLQHPTQALALSKSPYLLDNATEEVFRWVTPITCFSRTCSERFVLRGVEIDRGERVVLMFLSANYDSQVFSNPGTCDLYRSPNPHMAFGSGHHTCLGMHLARRALRAFLTPFAPLSGHLTQLEPVSYHATPLESSIASLIVSCR